ncbi:MAG: hypothetical protein WCF88_14345 [Candidatus Acidiferrales bacterium]
MKKSLIAGSFALLLTVGGCSTTPAAGPVGPQGPPGDQGAAGQNADRDRDRDRDKDRDRDAGPPPSCTRGQHPAKDPDGRWACVRD